MPGDQVGFSRVEQHCHQNCGSVTIEVQLQSPAHRIVTVDWETTNGNIAEACYVQQSGKVTIEAGSMVGSFQLLVTDDTEWNTEGVQRVRLLRQLPAAFTS